jgi:hypothetical protein
MVAMLFEAADRHHSDADLAARFLGRGGAGE